jgi:Zn finger protein HypA/HybF involved in hydrogenase expression
MNSPQNQLSNWQPPSGFTPVKSTVEGVTVFAPVPEIPDLDKPVSFKCPQCGATTRFDIAAGGVACEHCGYSAEPPAEQVGRRADEFEFTLETLEKSVHGWGVARQELHCSACGADIILAEGALTATCSFCASNKVNVHPAPSDTLRPRYLIPFKIETREIKDRARHWLGEGWFHPSELSSSVILERFTGVYMPFWTFDARIVSNWKAQVGYERQERYYDHHSKQWRSRTVIDWRWENGTVTLEIDDLLICGSSKASHVIMERVYPFNLNELVAYKPDFIAGWQAQAYDINLPTAWENGKNIMREKSRQACRASIRSSHVRNFTMTADFGEEVWRYILLPVYVSAYRFEEKVFQVLVNGQTGVVAGQKPVAWWKIWLAIAALITPGLLLGLIGLPMLALGGVGLIPIVIGAILLVGGGVWAFNIYKQAVASEAA